MIWTSYFFSSKIRGQFIKKKEKWGTEHLSLTFCLTLLLSATLVTISTLSAQSPDFQRLSGTSDTPLQFEPRKHSELFLLQMLRLANQL